MLIRKIIIGIREIICCGPHLVIVALVSVCEVPFVESFVNMVTTIIRNIFYIIIAF